jgi:signal transduction histidine kinase
MLEDDGETLGQKEVFNHTIVSMDELTREKFSGYHQMAYCRYTYEHMDFLIFKTTYEREIDFYWLVDISYVKRQLGALAVVMLLITLMVALGVSGILYYVITKSFCPLRELNASAQSMAEGDYQRRIQIGRKDELGMLAENFNQMAEAVKQHTKSLEESEYKKTLFMGNLTHELKTPMTAISGYAETLLMTKLEPEEEEEALHYIYTECGRLERLSKKMMQLLELEQGTELEFREHRIKELCDAAEESCSAILSQKDMRLKVEEHGETMLCDKDLMTNVLVNLIDNAVKASEDGSEILVRTEADKNGQPMIIVEDFGCGIPPEEQDKILEPFYMVDKSRSRRNGGAGLGLALIKLILEKHKLQLAIESEVGVGTRMKVTYLC